MKYKLNKNYIVQKLEDKVVIFDGEESVLFTLNDTASLIYSKLKTGTVKEKIVDELVKQYSVKKEIAEKDIDTLITDLKKQKIFV